MKNDEIDTLFDDLDFKPITKGLGFHHSIKEKSDLGLSLNSKKKELEIDLLNRAERLRESQGHKIAHSLMGELAPFYESEVKGQIELSLDGSASDTHSQTYVASFSQRLGAWVLDLMILLTVTIVTLSGIVIFSDLPLDIVNSFMISDDISVSALAFFGMFYLFYFSFFDKTAYSTPGKRICGIKVISLKKSINLSQSFFRSLITLGSILTLGLTALLGLQDRLTDTSVVKI